MQSYVPGQSKDGTSRAPWSPVKDVYLPTYLFAFPDSYLITLHNGGQGGQ